MGLSEARQTLRHRLEDVCREIGVLAIVFIPIDVVIAADTPRKQFSLLIFLSAGLTLLGGALILEYRRLRVDQ
jgi:hypothetical protein